MEDIIVARHFKMPIGKPEIEAGLAQSGWCLDLHSVRYRGSYLSLAGTRMICRFGAPDAEAVRMVMRTSPPWPDYVHAVSLHAAPGAPATESPVDAGGAALVVVERCFDEPMDFGDVQAMEDEGQWCLDRHAVRFRRSYFARDRQRMVCLYQAPDAEAVRHVQDRIGLPYEQVWSASVLVPAANA